MRSLLRICIAVSVIVVPEHVMARPPVPADPVVLDMRPLSDRMVDLPDKDYRALFGTMLDMEFRKGPDWEAFFGDVGPTAGCEAFKKIKFAIIDRDLAAFKAAYIRKVAIGMAPSAFSDIPDNRLAIPFNSRIDRFEQDLRDFLRPRIVELGNGARQWTETHGYRGRRLGYNAAGAPYWGSQSAMTVLVCILPDDSGLLRGWKD